MEPASWLGVVDRVQPIQGRLSVAEIFPLVTLVLIAAAMALVRIIV
jgi:hypothetical protein